MMTKCHAIILATLGLVLATSASAQYKYVGPDGRVTYSDRPAPTSENVVSQKKLNQPNTAAVVLPFEVQQASSRFPVTLYTGDKCPPCEEARTFLRNRGVPFTEKTITSDEDIALFRQQSPDGTAPVMSVGSRKSVGFAPTSWSALLDGAGYPQTNTLPRDYQNPVPTALSPNTRTPSQAIAGATPATAPRAPAPSAQPSTPAAPPGFRF